MIWLARTSSSALPASALLPRHMCHHAMAGCAVHVSSDELWTARRHRPCCRVPAVTTSCCRRAHLWAACWWMGWVMAC